MDVPMDVAFRIRCHVVKPEELFPQECLLSTDSVEANAGNLILIPLPFSGWPWSISCKFAVLSDGDWIACHKNWVLGHANLCFVSLFLCMTIVVSIFRLMSKPSRVC